MSRTRPCFYNPCELILGTQSVKKILPAMLALLVLAGCGSAETQEQRDRSFARDQESLNSAQRNATLQCRDQAQCDKVWKLTAAFVQQHSDTDVVRTDALAIDTDLPTRNGRVSYSATRVPKGSGATIALFGQCRGMYDPEQSRGSAYEECFKKMTTTQNMFADFVNQHLSGN
jgi:hypothetical protein